MSDDDYDFNDDLNKSMELAYRTIRERVKAGGPGWRDDEMKSDNLVLPSTLSQQDAERILRIALICGNGYRKAAGKIEDTLARACAEIASNAADNVGALVLRHFGFSQDAIKEMTEKIMAEEVMGNDKRADSVVEEKS